MILPEEKTNYVDSDDMILPEEKTDNKFNAPLNKWDVSNITKLNVDGK